MKIVTMRQRKAGLNGPRRSTLVVVRHAFEAAAGLNSSTTTAAVSECVFGR